MTSPPYNLGVRYRSYDDTLPRERYLEWTGAWIKAAAKTLDPAGSLFLNVGAKPTDPWTGLDVAQAARAHPQLQNTIHWIKSIAIDQDAAGARAGLARDLNVGHYKPINSDRFVNDCQEFIFHFTPGGRTELDRRAIGVKYQDQSNVARWGGGANNRRFLGNTWFMPYETIQSRARTAHTRRRSRRACPNIACAYTDSLAQRSCSIPSWDLATPPLLPRSSGLTSWESRSIGTICRKRSRASELRSNCARVNSQLPNSQFPINAQLPKLPKLPKLPTIGRWELEVYWELWSWELEVDREHGKARSCETEPGFRKALTTD